MYQPDFNFTVNAGTCLVGTTGDAKALRPWCGCNYGAPPLGDKCPIHSPAMCRFKKDNENVYMKARMHPMVKDWEKVTAQELIGQTANHLKRAGSDVKASDVTLENLKKCWRDDWNSHFVPEGRLPGIVPLSYVQKIVLPKDEKVLGGELTADEKKYLNKLDDLGLKIEIDDFKGFNSQGKMEWAAYDRAVHHCQEPLGIHRRVGLSMTLAGARFGEMQ